MNWYACRLVPVNADRSLSGEIPNPLGAHNVIVAAMIFDINGTYLVSRHVGVLQPRFPTVTMETLQHYHDCIVYCIVTKRWFVAWNRNEFRVQEGYQLYDVAIYTADSAIENDLESFLKSLGDGVGP